jgi:hypothetical protein
MPKASKRKRNGSWIEESLALLADFFAAPASRDVIVRASPSIASRSATKDGKSGSRKEATQESAPP